jgi:hypothetical protein
MASAYPIIWAMKHAPVADALERVILIAMADAADMDGCNSYRSYKTHGIIATGVDEATMRRKQRAMAKRGLIRPDTTPTPARYLDIPANRRPPRWEVCIPYSWWSERQIEEVQQDRADRGLPPLTPESRPDLADAPAKKPRADKGVPNPSRGHQKTPEDAPDSWGGTETPQDVDPRGGTETPPGVAQRHPQGWHRDTQPSEVPSGVHPPNPEERTESKPTETTPPATPFDTAAAIVGRIGVAKLNPHPTQIRQMVDLIADTLARPGMNPAAVERYAAAKVAEGHTVKYFVQAFHPRHLVELTAAAEAQPKERSALPPKCDDPRHSPYVRYDNRMLEDAEGLPIGPCPRCSVTEGSTPTLQIHGQRGNPKQVDPWAAMEGVA